MLVVYFSFKLALNETDTLPFANAKRHSNQTTTHLFLKAWL